MTRGKRGNCTGLTRRDFLKRSSAAVAGAFAFPAIIPASALGADGHVAPSNRVVMGCIGVGSQGTSNMGNFLERKGAQIIAVCDVDLAHRTKAKQLVDEAYGNADCQHYNDFRELLARDDIDAVSIAVPDHWHSIPAIAAARRGKHIYAEKPLSLTIVEGRAMVNAVEGAGIVWQTGSWQRSQEHFRKACELVRSGRVGEIHTVIVGLPTGSPIEPQPAMPIPQGFDYDFWLGPAPEAPYTEKRCHWNFRWILDYSGGQLTDWAAHHCDIANWGMGTEHTGPISVSGVGEFPREGLYNAAISYKLECQYAPGASPVAPKGFKMIVQNSSEATGVPMGTKFIGSEGSVFVDRGKKLITDPENLKDSAIGPNDVALYNSTDHFQNFIDCVHSGNPTITPIQPAHRAISIAHLGNISMRLGREVKWDPKKERFIDDSTADRMLARAMRGTWHI